MTCALTAADNAPSRFATVDATGRAAATGTLTFSDEASSISPRSATVIIDAPDYVLVSGLTTTISVTVTVLDQYGSPFSGAMVNLNVRRQRPVQPAWRAHHHHRLRG